MVEYYGWLKILDDSYGANYLEQQAFVEKIKAKLQEIFSESKILESHWMNGQFILCTAGCRNHMAKETNNIVAFFKWVAQLDIGSYGLLYVYDDENQNGKDDEFQIFKVAKGKITVEKDSLLSPCTIKILDDEDESQF